MVSFKRNSISILIILFLCPSIRFAARDVILIICLWSFPLVLAADMFN
jgi:hypothetical protein